MLNDTFASMIQLLARVGSLLIVGILLLYLAKMVLHYSLALSLRSEISRKDNPALGTLFGAFLLATGIAISGSFFGHWQDSIGPAVLKMLPEGLLAIVLLRMSIWINDHSILSDFSIAKEIGEDRNLGVGITVAASAIASGMIINGAFTGYSPTYTTGLRDIVVYWTLGQALLVIAGMVFRRIKQYDVHRLLEYDDNPAVGWSFGGYLVGIGIVVRGSTIGSGLSPLGTELWHTALLSLVGGTLLTILHQTAPRLILGGIDLREEIEMNRNTTIGITMACLTIAIALFIAELIKR